MFSVGIQIHSSPEQNASIYVTFERHKMYEANIPEVYEIVLFPEAILLSYAWTVC